MRKKQGEKLESVAGGMQVVYLCKANVRTVFDLISSIWMTYIHYYRRWACRMSSLCRCLGYLPSLFCVEDRHLPKLHSLIEQDIQVVQGHLGQREPFELQW